MRALAAVLSSLADAVRGLDAAALAALGAATAGVDAATEGGVVTVRLTEARLVAIHAALAAGGLALPPLPELVPPDTALTGTLSGAAGAGWALDLAVASPLLRGALLGTASAATLALRFTGTLRPATIVRRLAAPPAAAPRDEDEIELAVTLEGTLAAPVLSARLAARELGFRLGRPRFVPPVLVRGVVGEARWERGFVLRAIGMAHGHPIELELVGRRLGLHAPLLGAEVGRDVLRTLGAAVAVPDLLAAAVDVAWDGGVPDARLSGAVTVTTPLSHLVVTPEATGDARVRGHLAGLDARTTGRLPAWLVPEAGAVEIDVRTDLRSVATGTVAPRGLELAIGARRVVLDRPLRVTLDRALEVGTAAGTALRFAAGHLTGALALADLAPLVVLPLEGLLALDLRVQGTAVQGTVSADRLVLTAAGSEIVLTDVRARLDGDPACVRWNPIAGRAHGGTFTTRGVLRRDRSFVASGAVLDVAVDDIPRLAGRVTASAVRGRLDGLARARRAPGEAIVGDGRLVLREGAFPVLARVAPTLQRYGLEVPQTETTAPATALLRAGEAGFFVDDIVVELVGTSARGGVGIGRDRTLGGTIEVTLADEYLGANKRLALPRVFVDRLAVPLKLSGTLAAPEIQPEVSGALGRALVDNRLTAWFGRDAKEKRKEAAELDDAIEHELDALLADFPAPRQA